MDAIKLDLYVAIYVYVETVTSIDHESEDEFT